jgi:hypothetical protein
LWTKKFSRTAGPRARLRAWLLLPAESFYVTEVSEVRKFLVDSLRAAPIAAQQIETAGAGLAIDYCGLRCIGGPPPTPPLASLSGVKSRMSFLFGSGFCVSLSLIGFLVLARLHSGIEPLCAGE